MIEKIHKTRCGEVHYWITERVSNDKPTLLFLPGLTADHRLFEKQIEYFESRLNVFVWDAPAHSSSWPFSFDFSLEEGEFVTVMGPSGSGKSTLLYCVSGMDQMTSGSVMIDGCDISQMSEKQLTEFRLKKMGFVFQQMYMLKKLSIMDNILLPGFQAKLKSRQEVTEDVQKLMRRLNIIDVADHEITEVSGGQLQRACICRALVNNPKIVFADEPTGSLNSKASEEVMKEMIEANKSGTAVLMVTHSEKVAAMSERIIYLVDGNIKGEIKLGKMDDSQQLVLRERKIKNWLDEMGW